MTRVAASLVDRVEGLRRLARLGQTSGDPAIAAAGVMIEAWLDTPEGEQRDLSLGPNWRFRYRQAMRDAALLRLRDRWFPDLSGRPAARAVSGALAAYQSRGGWRRDRETLTRPAGLRGACYDVLMWGEPLGEEASRRLFAARPDEAVRNTQVAA
jgi:hypothetical protein